MAAPQRQIDLIVRVVALSALLAVCIALLSPFLSAALWAAIFCFSSWPAYAWLERRLGGRRGIAAGIFTTGVLAVMVVPLAVIGTRMADDAGRLLAAGVELFRSGLPDAPSWLAGLPVIGPGLSSQWGDMAHDPAQLAQLTQEAVSHARGWLLRSGASIGQGIVQILVASFLGFFLFRDGQRVVERLRSLLVRVAGPSSGRYVEIVGSTVRGAVYGIGGSALAQGALTAIGLVIARVPSAALLSLLATLLSVLPVGPVLIWAPAAFWLWRGGAIGRAIFLAAWGLVAVSTADNVIKPYFIGKGNDLPFVLILLGIFGGIGLFGFIGIFIGPAVLAVALAVVSEWVAEGPAGPAEERPHAGGGE